VLRPNRGPVLRGGHAELDLGKRRDPHHVADDLTVTRDEERSGTPVAPSFLAVTPLVSFAVG